MTKITKAVLACGGWSTRFLPTTKVIAKQLVPILDKPQIQYIFEECLNAGVEEFCIVHREGETSLQSFFAPNSELTKYLSENNKSQYLDQYNLMISRIKKLVFLPQTNDFPYGNGSPILVAQDFINQENFLYLFADDLLIEKEVGSFTKRIIETFNQNDAKVVIGCQQVAHHEVSKYGIVDYKKDSTIPHQLQSIVEKPTVETSPSDFADFGRVCLTSNIIDILKTTAIDRGELWIVDAIKTIINQGELAIGLPTISPETWITTGDPLNWLKANVTVALSDPKIGPSIKEFIHEKL